MQESFTDTIAFNQLFSGEITGVIVKFFKKFKRRAGGQTSRSDTKGEKKSCLSQAQATQGKSLPTFRGKKREREGKGECDCNRGWAFEVRPRIRSFETLHANSTPSAALTNDF